MRIAQVCRAFLPVRGGMETHIYNLSKALVKRNHEVTVYTTTAFLKDASACPTEEVVNGINVKRFKALAKLAGYWYAPSLKNALLKDETDIIHAHSYAGYWINAATKAKKVKRTPLILTPYAFYHTSTHILLKRTYDAFMGKESLKKADALIVFTELEREMCHKRGVNQSKVFVIPEGVDLELFNPNVSRRNIKDKYGSEDKIILYIGRIDTNKGLEHLIESMPIILKRVPNALLLIVGKDWGFKAILERLIVRRGIGQRVFFIGEVSHEETPNFYAASNVLVLPSAYESQGLVLCEAMACGKPVIATRVGCIPGIIKDGWNGILVEYGSPHQLAEAVIKILTDESLAKKVALNGYHYATENLALDITVEKIESVYEILSRR